MSLGGPVTIRKTHWQLKPLMENSGPRKAYKHFFFSGNWRPSSAQAPLMKRRVHSPRLYLHSWRTLDSNETQARESTDYCHNHQHNCFQV